MDFFAAFCLFLAFFIGIGFSAVVIWLINRKALSIIRGQAGQKGRQAQAEQQDDMLALIGEVALQFKEAKANNEDLKTAAMRILPAAAAAHPFAAMKLGKKLVSTLGKGGGLAELGGLLE
jgi:hypothetical protein